MQGTPNTNSKPNPLIREVVDLDALFAERSLKPTPVKLGGKTYEVRTDLTSVECDMFLALWNQDGKRTEALSILVGKRDAVGLDRALAKMPHVHQATAAAHILRASRALAQFAISDEALDKRYGEPGESSAS